MIPYKQIFEEFSNEENIDSDSIKTYCDYENEVRLKDEELADKWRDYHDNKASYRLLCRPCNGHFGAYKTKK